MRSHLSRLIAGLLLLSGLGLPAWADVNPTNPVDVYGVNGYGVDGYSVEPFPGQILPSGDLELPGPADSIGPGRERAGPAPQAIPTPTAFHAGLGLLAVMLILGRFRGRTRAVR